jgi:threonine dehydrogenase-like Zn-dependent dehydrogenase
MSAEIATNRKAARDFHILERYEAGVELRGTEVKSIRQGKINTEIWITHRIGFDDVPEKFAQFTDPNLGAIKAIIEVR